MKKLLLPLFAFAAVNGAIGQTYFSDDFNDVNLTGWTNIDDDTDNPPASGTNYDLWYAADFSGYYPENGAGTAVSRSWAGTAYTPNNFLITPAIDLTSASASGLTLLFRTGSIEPAPYFDEHYAVYVTTANDIPSITASTPVFEETLPGNQMYSHSIDMSAYAGMTVYVTFRHFNTNDENTLLLDDVRVKTLAPNDAAVDAVNLARYAETSTNSTLSVAVENVGANAITSVEINWNDGTDHTATISTNIAPGATVNVNHPTAVNYATVVEESLTVTITAVNGGADPDPSNNAGAALHNTVSQVVPKNVVIEEGTGTWCGWCPRGAVAMDYMISTYPDQFIGIAVHNGDPMTVTAYDNGANISGYPGCNVDRALLDQGVSQAAFENYYNARKDLIVPADLSVAVSGTGANVVLDVDATFYTNFSAADYRLAAVIIENGVTGTGGGYDQVNYYAGGGQGAMGGYEALPDPVPAAQMVYDHVGRALLGGYDGQAGSVPAAITDGAVASYTFNYTVPATSNRAQMYAVAMLIDQATGEIVNAEEVWLSSVGVEEAEMMDMNVYPNPASENLTVAFEAQSGDYTVSVTDLQGRVVWTNDYTNLAGAQALDINVSSLIAGNYLVSIAVNGASYTKMVTIK